jgi:hypothetical protein
LVGARASAALVRHVEAFDIEYVGEDGGLVRASLAECRHRRFEAALPARAFPVYRSQRSFSGWWWTATTGGHVGYESWLERSVLIGLDFDVRVVGIASQPFWLSWFDGRRVRRHAPDYFVRLADGTKVVVDVRADDRIEPRDAEAFAATAMACAEIGWAFRRVGEASPVREANLRWLAGYRHPRCYRPEIAERLRAVFAEPGPLFVGADAVGERIGVLPVLFHLAWRQVLVADLDAAPLAAATVVGLAGGGTDG